MRTRASVVDLDVQQVKQLIVGAPGSEVTLSIARPVAHWQRHVAPQDQRADGGAEPQGHVYVCMLVCMCLSI